jgi:homoserine/homoserine lactone efflux protein
MDLSLFLSFLAAAFIIVVTPGSTVALASSRAVKSGPRAAFITVLGDALGTATQIVIAVLGLQILVGLASQILPYMQIAGGLYILFLGYQSITETRPKTNLENQQDMALNADPKARKKETGGYFWAGFFVCISNPKSIIFFIALFPGFISQELNVMFQSLVYGVVFILLDAMFIMGYSILAIKTFNSSKGASLNIKIVSGVGLSLVGILLIWNGFSVL